MPYSKSVTKENEERFYKVTALMEENPFGSVKDACAKIGMPLSCYYTARAVLGKSKPGPKKKISKKELIPTHAAVVSQQSTDKPCIVVIGTPQDCLKVLEGVFK